MNFKPNVAIYGGAFDPIHMGHLFIIQALIEIFSFKKVMIIPSGESLTKKMKASAFHRLNCLKIALKNEANIEINDFEIKQKGPHFTYSTLSHLREKEKLENREITFILGSDQFSQIESWFQFPEVLFQSNWIIFNRKGDSIESLEKTKSKLISQGVLKPLKKSSLTTAAFKESYETDAHTQVHFADIPLPECSSSDIRKELAIFGELKKPSLFPTNVYDYLKENELYGTKP